MSMKWLHPKCKKCGRRGKLTKEDLCAICSMEKNKVWPREFMEDSDKASKH